MKVNVKWCGAWLVMVMACCGAVLTSGCSSDEPVCDEAVGYFRVPGTGVKDLQVDQDAGNKEVKMTGTPTETVIPLVLITDDMAKINRPRYDWEWESWHRKGTAYVPEYQYKADGYESYPNTLDYTYAYQWVTFSTVKEQGSENGVLSVSYDANPYNEPRTMIAYLKNEDWGIIVIEQRENPDGIDPPEVGL